MNLHDLRTQVEQTDRMILGLIKERMDICKDIGMLKTQIEDKQREQTLQTLWQEEAAALGLSEDCALAVLDALLTESKTIQRAQ